MANTEILTKAIQKAIEGKWYKNGLRVCSVSYGLERGFHDVTFTIDVKGGEITETWNLYELIFNHDFAKALWGEERVSVDLPEGYWLQQIDESGNDFVFVLPAWQYHLQQMVIAEDPIKYLGEHI